MNNHITMSEVKELTNPALRKIGKRVAREIELTIHKVVAHDSEPAKYPLPADADSIEQILWQYYRTTTPAQRALAASRVMPTIKKMSPKSRRRFGDLAGVDLESAVPIAEQVSKLPFPADLAIPAASLRGIVESEGQDAAVGEPGLVPQQTTNHLEFRIRRVKCVDETNTLGTEFGKDDILLAGTAIDETGDTHKIAPFKVGTFNDGDVVPFPTPRQFTAFNLREGTEFPKSYFITLVLAEQDHGGLSEFVDKLLNKVKERVVAALAAAIGAAAGTASGGPVGTVIGLVVGIAVGKAFEALQAAVADEVFEPNTVSVAVPSLSHKFKGGKTESPEGISTFKGHDGTYQVAFDWRMVA